MAASLPFQISSNEAVFERQLRSNIQHFQLFENKSNQLQALTRVPLEDLKAIAQAKYDSSDLAAVEGSGEAKGESTVKDMLLMELMDWFKTEFFTWMNSPPCPRCQKSTVGIGSGVPTQLEMSMSAGRVELFTCTSCFTDRREVARFPRYNNPVVLLDTRTGRCGEWANCFALICRAAGFEVRHVHDHTDHVWVEVYSSSMSPNRWVHVDPCENSYDNPLLYEVGWGKKLTYIIAISQDDIQDVTPRYTVDFRQALTRRNDVREDWLVSQIVKMRKELQAKLPESRKFQLLQRWTQEIVELITPKEAKTVKDSEKAGRESGSIAWRLAMQELGEGDSSPDKPTGFVWEVGQNSVYDGKFELSYEGGLDTYSRKNDKGELVHLRGWQNGVFSSEDIFRKEEHDWKMVYLATRENAKHKSSTLFWKFQILPEYSVEDVKISMKYSIFQSDAKFSINVITDSDKKTILETNAGDEIFSWDLKSTSTNPEFQALLCKSKTVTVSCELKSGSGNEGWQKVQLFRQQVTSGKPLSALNRNLFYIEIRVNKIN